MPNKFSKEDVGFESPAVGRNHCSGCVYFQMDKPHGCHIVAGLIMPEDWCEKWTKREQSKYESLLQIEKK